MGLLSDNDQLQNVENELDKEKKLNELTYQKLKNLVLERRAFLRNVMEVLRIEEASLTEIEQLIQKRESGQVSLFD